MPKVYRHKKQYEKEILELKAKGLTHREIAERLGFEQIQIKEFFHRYTRTQRKQAAGIPLKRKGRPRKNENELPPSIQQLSKLTQLQYELASKARHIKRLEMENELMRDFLSLTGWK